MRALFASLFILFCGVSTASAMPATPEGAGAAENLLMKVHRGHGRRCRYGRVHRWDYNTRHRHRGRGVYRCGKRWRGKRGYRKHRYRHHRKCFSFGPFSYCK